MYRLSLILLLAASSVQSHNSCNRGQWNHARNIFNTLSNDVIHHDHDMMETCKHFKQYPAREVMGKNAYRLEVMLNGFDSASWDLRIKHRVIYINGHYPRQGKTCDLTYVDIKVLPHFVNTHSASWTYCNNMLIVAFPYKYTLNSHPLTCSRDIDETLIYVRRGFPTDKIFY